VNPVPILHYEICLHTLSSVSRHIQAVSHSANKVLIHRYGPLDVSPFP
jgi:hypothetical protein